MNNLTQGVLPTSQEIANNPKISTGQGLTGNRKGERLANDLLGILQSTSNFFQENNTLSVKAAQRVANDSLTQMAIDINAVEAQRTPNTDLRQEQLEIEMIYQRYGRKTFDNEDSQRAFDDIYHKQGALTVSEKSAILNRGALKQDAEKLHNKILTDFTEQSNANVVLSNEQIVGAMESLKGWIPEKQLGSEFVNISIQAFENKYKTLQSLDVYGADGVAIDINKLDKAANSWFGAYATIKDGQWVGKKGVPVGAVSAAQDAFNQFVDNNRTNRLTYKGNTNIPTAYGTIKVDAMSSQQAMNTVSNIKSEMTQKINLYGEAYQNSSEYFSSMKYLALAQGKVKMIESLENNFNEAVLGKKSFNDFLNNDYTQQVVDVGGQEITLTLTPDEVDSFYDAQIRKQEQNAKDMPYEQGKQLNDNNIYTSLGRMSLESGNSGNLFKQDTTNLLNGVFEGSSYNALKDSVRKIRDYNNGTKANNWLTSRGTSQSIEATFATLDREIETGNIDTKTAMIQAKAVLNSHYEASKSLSVYNATDPMVNQVQKEIVTLMQDMDDFTDRWAWLPDEIGDKQYIDGYTRAVLRDINQQGFTNTDAAKAYVQDRTALIRVGNPLIPFFRKTFPVFTGETPINPTKASETITQRLAEDKTLMGLGDDFSDSNVKLIQGTDTNGEMIMRVQFRDPNNPYALLAEHIFTTGQLNRGATKSQYQTKSKPTQQFNPNLLGGR